MSIPDIVTACGNVILPKAWMVFHPIMYWNCCCSIRCRAGIPMCWRIALLNNLVPWWVF